ncbi:MAG: hypothetical protein RMK18_03295 [Armatimonadota bacterium]|nr:hypothetical protein [Armatimonadota bacterium]MDW8024875.1 hypothetical protein [Armatimonadota bacterium]
MRSELPSEIIAYGFTALTELRWQFLRALQDNDVKTLEFFVPASVDNEQAYSYTHEFLKLLGLHGAKIRQIQSDGLPDELNAATCSAFLRQEEQEIRQLTYRIVCIAAAGKEQEVEMVTRVLTQWRREGKLQRYSDALLVHAHLTIICPR